MVASALYVRGDLYRPLVTDPLLGKSIRFSSSAPGWVSRQTTNGIGDTVILLLKTVLSAIGELRSTEVDVGISAGRHDDPRKPHRVVQVHLGSPTRPLQRRPLRSRVQERRELPQPLRHVALVDDRVTAVDAACIFQAVERCLCIGRSRCNVFSWVRRRRVRRRFRGRRH